MPHTLSLRLFAICLAISISAVGEFAMLTSSQPGPQELTRLRSLSPAPALPVLPETMPLALIPMAHV